MKKKNLRIGVVGLGIGTTHLRRYMIHPQAQVVAACDADTERLQNRADEFGIEGLYTSFDDMLAKADLDVCSICTPNFLHAAMTVKALKAGAHVLIEKPMAMNASEAREMIRCAEKCGKRLMVSFNQRFEKQHWALKAQIDSGALGEPYYGRTVWHRHRNVPRLGGWFTDKKQSGGGPLIDLGVHRLDLALWLMGHPEPDWVVGGAFHKLMKDIAREAGEKSTVEDMCVGMIHFKNGAILELEASWAGYRPESDYLSTRLYGTRGGLLAAYSTSEKQYTCELYSREPGGSYSKKLCHPAEDPFSPSYHFVDCIVKSKPHIAEGKEGLAVQLILDALYKSAESGEAVKIGGGATSG